MKLKKYNQTLCFYIIGRREIILNMSDTEIGQCCFCMGDCNIHSQACGRCVRNGPMFIHNALPFYHPSEPLFTAEQEARIREILGEMIPTPPPEEERRSPVRKRPRQSRKKRRRTNRG